mgnify:FL=1
MHTPRQRCLRRFLCVFHLSEHFPDARMNMNEHQVTHYVKQQTVQLHTVILDACSDVSHENSKHLVCADVVCIGEDNMQTSTCIVSPAND